MLILKSAETFPPMYRIRAFMNNSWARAVLHNLDQLPKHFVFVVVFHHFAPVKPRQVHHNPINRYVLVQQLNFNLDQKFLSGKYVKIRQSYTHENWYERLLNACENIYSGNVTTPGLSEARIVVEELLRRIALYVLEVDVLDFFFLSN